MARMRQHHSDAANKSVFLPMELVTEILSLLSVKDMMRLRCVCKSWNNLTYDSNFVDKHLKVSSRNPHLTLSWFQKKPELTNNVVPFPVHRLYKESSATVSSDDFHRMTIEIRSWVVGSCNGLLFFLSRPLLKCIFYISNPATRTRSRNFEFPFGHKFSFTFGYDASTRTYKVVAFRAELEYSEVKVFNLGDKYCWRNIQNFPLVPHNRLDLHHYYTERRLINNGVHFYGTINWLALDKSINGIYRFVIVSLDLSTETYKQFLPPTLGCDHMAIYKPTLRVLMDSLCFSHEDSNKTKFILWKMKEYGVEESWTQLFEISYQNLAMQLPKKLSMNNIDYGIQYRLVCLYVNGDIAIFASGCCNEAFFYNLKDKTVVKMIESKHYIYRLYDSKDYVESLVSVY